MDDAGAGRGARGRRPSVGSLLGNNYVGLAAAEEPKLSALQKARLQAAQERRDEVTQRHKRVSAQSNECRQARTTRASRSMLPGEFDAEFNGAKRRGTTGGEREGEGTVISSSLAGATATSPSAVGWVVLAQSVH